jgi:hypothetical protein
MVNMKTTSKAALLLLGLGLAVDAACADTLADSVFEAIDKLGDGLRTVNKEVRILQWVPVSPIVRGNILLTAYS